jgi:hypothetical protein
MIDDVHFQSPLGPLGWFIDWGFMTGYLRRLLAGRAMAIKREAEPRMESPKSPIRHANPVDSVSETQ